MMWKDLLKKIKVFKDLTPEEINLVEQLVKERIYKAGTKIIKEGEPSTEFFICLDGELIIQIDVPGRGAITTRTIGDRNIFGWSALTNIPYCAASVVTIKDTKVLVFTGAELKKMFENHPRTGYLVMRNLIDVVSSRLQDIRFGLASCITDHG
ncbi:cyclic nucleotide-binding domain-containing protein [candidate division WOR-3 bacterium]|nr:cyclic nucleotide-binding domain-containing protein [candidate division WOR-3 bacterium]